MPSPIVLRRLALAGAATGVAALTGCSAVTTSGFAPTTGQASPLAPVDLSQQFCANTDGTPTSDEACAPFEGYASGSTFVPFTTPGSGRLLVLAQVADGAPDPVFRLRRSPDAPLVREDAVIPSSTPAEDGHHWVGYRSAVIAYALGERNPGDLLEASVPVQPLAARSSVRTVGVGVQVIQDGRGKDYGDRPVVCAENLEGSSDIDSTTCPGSGDRAGLDTTDAQVSAPQPAAADAGTTATLDFAVAQAGTVAEASALRVDASSTVDGGSVTPGTTEIPWAITPEPPVDPDPGDDGTIQDRPAQRSAPARRATVVGEDGVARTPVAVAVAVPDATPTGDYAVTLRIRDTAGVERTATANLRVTGKPVVPAPTPAAPAAPMTPAPAAVLSTLKATKVNPTRRRLHAGRVACKSSTRCIVSTVVRAGSKRVGFLRFTLKPGKSGAVSLRLSRPATALLAKRGGTVTVSVDAGGPKTLVRVTKVAVQQG